MATKFTEPTRTKILHYMEAGVAFSRAASMAKITPRCAFLWLERGRSELKEGRDTVYSRFATDVEAARASTITNAEKYVHRAVAGKVKNLEPRDRLSVSKWVLACMARDEYGDSIEVRLEKRIEEFLDDLEPLMPPKSYEDLKVATLRLYQMGAEDSG